VCVPLISAGARVALVRRAMGVFGAGPDEAWEMVERVLVVSVAREGDLADEDSDGDAMDCVDCDGHGFKGHVECMGIGIGGWRCL